MPTPDDDIQYFPSQDDPPAPPGGRGESPQLLPPSDGITTTYADLNYLRSMLDALLTSIRFAQSDMETALNTFSLVVTNSQQDATLRQANETEWPSSLGPVRNFISYKYYQLLGIKTSKSAAYIRQRYEDAVRDVTGSNAIDLLQILDIFKNEAFLIQEFLDNYIGAMDDTSEFRAAELLQDWVEKATDWTSTIQSIFENQTGLNTFSGSDIDQATETDARKAQALFKVKLNSLNDEIVQNLELFKKNYAEYADVFYRKFLGPGLTVRLDVSRNIYPTSGLLSKEMTAAAGSLDSNFSIALADLLRRNRIFDGKVQEILQAVTMRDTYRNYINQLATKGVSIPRGTAGTTIDSQDSADEFEFFKNQLDALGTQEASSNVFQSPHDLLDGRGSDSAHPQYLLRSGGRIIGNIFVDDNIRIDGIDLNTHRHTGIDGSAQIFGSSIAPGTLGSGSVDTSAKPPIPTELRVTAEDVRPFPSGLSVVDIALSWTMPEDDETLSFEVNIAPI